MKKISLKIFIIIIGISCLVLINPIRVNAALQSNGGTNATKGVDDWIVQIRQMEATGGTLGLNEEINTTGLLATTDSNGLDCHMQKNTEYGAMILLSASSYGNPDPIADGGTTTGNATGVVMNLNNEWVAAGAGLTATTYAKAADPRYINNDYGTTSGGVYHVGDAMKQGDWHFDEESTWFAQTVHVGLLRAFIGTSVFSYSGYYSSNASAAHFENLWSSRAVIVCGTGL